jgi:hypothetical protein
MIRLLGATAFAAIAISTSGCGGSAQSAPPPPKPVEARPPPPEGPTRTDFKTIAQKLVSRCVAGGWIHKWRSTNEDPLAAKPKIYLRDFDDQTKQDLDPQYLTSELERKMRQSGVFEMVSEDGGYDFIGRGKLLRLAERTGKGDRVSVYTAVLELIDPSSSKVAYSCEATVKGDM